MKAERDGAAVPAMTVDACLGRASQLIGAQAWPEALACCNEALALAPLHALAHHLAGFAAGRLGMADVALSHNQQAVELDPRQALYRYNLAVDLGLKGREREAAIQYQACLRQDPGHRDALWNYGEMLRLSEHFDLAAGLLERFALNGGNYPALHHRLAVVNASLGRDAEAQAHFTHELKASDRPDELTHWEYALFLLSRERFEAGFSHYARRFHAGGRNSVFCHPFKLPLWQGRFVAGSVLLIHGEQGLGDELMFASVLPEVLVAARETNSRVILAVKPPLVKIFAENFPSAMVRAHRVGSSPMDLSEFGAVDWQLPMGDLPVLFRHTLEDFKPAQQAYLHADPARVQWYAQQLAALEPPLLPPLPSMTAQTSGPMLRVGLMWGSNPATVNDKFVRWGQQRSIPVQKFERLAHLLPQVRFVSLQNPERGDEAALAPGLDIFDLSGQQTDFFETAALIANLDLVISVDTSVAHLAGAMGKETWVPLMARSDWRHGHKRSSSYWYPCTRYFHQSVSGDWTGVMDALAQALEDRLDGRLEEGRLQPAGGVAAGGALHAPVADGQRDLEIAIDWLHRREFDQARPYFEQALARTHNSLRVQWEYGLQLLTEGLSSDLPPATNAGAMARGWDFHEARHAIFGWESLHLCPLPWPAWTGQPLAGKTIVVHGEQGIGDEIMYLSMLADLLARGGQVVVACVPPLVSLIQYSFPTIRVLAHPRGAPQDWHTRLPDWTRSIAEELGAVDFQIPMGSLGQQLRRSASDFPCQAYLQVDPKRLAAMALRLDEALQARTPSASAAAPVRRVGLAWCGSLGDANARARSIPLKKMLSLAEFGRSHGIQFVSLQSRQYAKQAAEVPEFSLIDMSEHTDDFADLAALMAHLDLIISVDTSYAHLAGALGLPTWRLLIRTCDWRWGWGRDDSVWYPNDRLFRQPKDGDWDAVIQNVMSEFKKINGAWPT